MAKSKSLKVTSTGLLALLLVASCMPQSPTSIGRAPLQNSNFGIKLNTQINGKVEFPDFKIKAVLSDISPSATVSLLYPTDSASKNVAIATGLTDTNGNFTINPSTGFAPVTGDIFILSVSKRIGGAGNAIMALQTLIRWTGTAWESITTPGIFINSKTTALTVIANYNPSTVKSSDLINKLTVVNNTAQVADITTSVATTPPTIIPAKTINLVADLVTQTLGFNQDPVNHITFTNGIYSLVFFQPPVVTQPLTNVTTTLIGTVFSSGTTYNPFLTTTKLLGIGTTLPGATVQAYEIPVTDTSFRGRAITCTDSTCPTGSTGKYMISNVPIGVPIQIVAFTGNPAITTCPVGDFSCIPDYAPRGILQTLQPGASNTVDFSDKDALQDEPELNSVIYNPITDIYSLTGGIQADVVNTSTGAIGPKSGTNPGGQENPPLINSAANVNNVKSDNLKLYLNFSEPVLKFEVEGKLQLVSHPLAVLGNNVVRISGKDGTFVWDTPASATTGSYATFTTNKPVLAAIGDPQALYRVGFLGEGVIPGPFTGNPLPKPTPIPSPTPVPSPIPTAVGASPTPLPSPSPTPVIFSKAVNERYFWYNRFIQANSFALSVLNDTIAPKLKSFQAIDGGLSNDKLIIEYSEPLDVLGRVVSQAILQDPGSPASLSKQNWIVATNNLNSLSTPNNATLLGFNSDNSSPPLTSGFRFSYTVGRITSTSSTSTFPLRPLATYDSTLFSTPSQGTANNVSASFSPNTNTVTLTFSSNAFDLGDTIVLSTGSASIAGTFKDGAGGIHDLVTGAGFVSKEITDPAGNTLTNNNQTTANGVTVNDRQVSAIVK